MGVITVHEFLFVPGQFPTIQAAIDATSGPATIMVTPQLYPETVYVIDKPYVVIQSTRLSRRGVTISGNDSSSVIRVERSTLHLSGIEIRSIARCRGLLVTSSYISLQECVVAGNRVGEGAPAPTGEPLPVTKPTGVELNWPRNLVLGTWVSSYFRLSVGPK